MAERGGDRGGFGRGFGGGRPRGDRGRGGRRRPRRDEEEKWVPVTKLGRLVKADKIKSLVQGAYLSSCLSLTQTDQLYFSAIIVYVSDKNDFYILAACYEAVTLAATFDCLLKTYGFLTPEFWRETRFSKSPFQEHTDLLTKPVGKLILEEPERVEA
ncbi:40S ribosomal protein S2-4 [Morella rubra]|uniref:40S ribosomal protein S2-4 n=1 Tax=Morella rubra TaxID=262757 RepID=A0A6A1WF72_9ROSI|nr:40S ribosomal protein S2-4 [Morella rubra]